jgi:folylpolyglutamate synthase/dihydropteroate synthase
MKKNFLNNASIVYHDVLSSPHVEDKRERIILKKSARNFKKFITQESAAKMEYNNKQQQLKKITFYNIARSFHSNVFLFFCTIPWKNDNNRASIEDEEKIKE